MPTRTERRKTESAIGRRVRFSALLALAGVLVGCGGEPTGREVKNAQAFEALLTAISLKNPKEVEGDAKLIEERHTAGEISEGKYKELAALISESAREGLERRREAGIRVPRNSAIGGRFSIDSNRNQSGAGDGSAFRPRGSGD